MAGTPEGGVKPLSNIISSLERHSGQNIMVQSELQMTLLEIAIHVANQDLKIKQLEARLDGNPYTQT